MLNIYLLRHGETSYNADGNRYCGRTDIGLTLKGRQQAEAVRQQLQSISFDAVYSSPLERAYYTACIASGSDQVTKDARLIELDFGLWEGKTREEFIAEDPEIWAGWVLNPELTRAGQTGENAAEVVFRVADFFQEILGKYRHGNVLVVAHNGINRLYLAAQLGMPLANYRRIVQENSAVTLFSLSGEGEFSLKLLNSKI